MIKLVNVKAIYPITGVPQIIRGTLNKVEMTTENIFKCLCGRAEVTEVIGDTLIPLDFGNYNKNNKPAVIPAVVPTTPKIVDITPEVKEVKATLVAEPVTVAEVVSEEVSTITEDVVNDEPVVDNTNPVAEEVDDTTETTSDEEDSIDDSVEEETSTTPSANVNNYSRKKHKR